MAVLYVCRTLVSFITPAFNTLKMASFQRARVLQPWSLLTRTELNVISKAQDAYQYCYLSEIVHRAAVLRNLNLKFPPIQQHSKCPQKLQPGAQTGGRVRMRSLKDECGFINQIHRLKSFIKDAAVVHAASLWRRSHSFGG